MILGHHVLGDVPLSFPESVTYTFLDFEAVESIGTIESFTTTGIQTLTFNGLTATGAVSPFGWTFLLGCDDVSAAATAPVFVLDFIQPMPAVTAQATVESWPFGFGLPFAERTAVATLNPWVMTIYLTFESVTTTANLPSVVGASAENVYPMLAWARVLPWALDYGAAAPSTTVAVFNANTLAVSEYSLAALDVVAHEGELYFVTATGLVKLAADAEGVAGSITTGDLELSDGSLSLNLARLGLTADGELHLTATAHQDGGERSVRYLIPTRAGANDRDRNVKLGNGVLGNAWSFTLAPPTGEACNWSLSGWKIEPGQFKLRRR